MPNADVYAEYLADKVLSRRSELGLTQAQLAKQAGVSRHLVSNVENGAASSISLAKVLPILEVLGLELLITAGISLAQAPRPENDQIDAYYDQHFPCDKTLFGGTHVG